MKYFTNMFLSIENKARRTFEDFPFTHAFLAGVGVIIFWRGIWEIADRIALGPVLSIIVGIVILVGIGLFVQTFVGNAIIIKNVEREKRLEEKTKIELKGEEITLAHLAQKLEMIESKVDSLVLKDSQKS